MKNQINFNELMNMSIEDLRGLNRLVIDAIKSKQALVAHDMRQELRSGDNVKVNHRKTFGRVFIVKEIKKTRCTVRSVDGRENFVVPMSMVEKIS